MSTNLSVLFWEHPDGHIVKVPCVHPKTVTQNVQVKIPGYNKTITLPGSNTTANVPGFNIAGIRWDGATVNISIPGPSGDVHFDDQNITFPVTLPGLQHPEGDDGPTVPCWHPFRTYTVDVARNIVFHTSNSFVQNETKKAIDRLAALMVRPSFLTSSIRPLHVFNRPLLSNYPQDARNPFWSHYEPDTHAINIHFDATANQTDFLDALHHELGHASIGQNCVQIPTPGGGHGMDAEIDPALAMSEGWAHFVALAIRDNQDTLLPALYWGQRWEARNAAVAPNLNIESNVARLLWDIYDTGRSVTGGWPPRTMYKADDEAMSFPFKELYKVFSPTLATLQNGPLIPSINDYIARLKENNPVQAEQIEQVRVVHCG